MVSHSSWNILGGQMGHCEVSEYLIVSVRILQNLQKEIIMEIDFIQNIFHSTKTNNPFWHFPCFAIFLALNKIRLLEIMSCNKCVKIEVGGKAMERNFKFPKRCINSITFYQPN